MRFETTYLLAFIGAASAAAVAIPESDSNTVAQAESATENPAAVLTKRNSYDCKGSSSCGILQVKYCDHAVNTLIRNGDLNYGAPGSGKALSGNCWSNINGDGCGVFIQGTDSGTGKACIINGNQMWNDYQEIRRSGCGKCGSKHYDSGCLVTINYVTNCDNRDHL